MSSPAFTPDNVLAAMATMRSADASKKTAAMDFLTSFQKSDTAWSVTVTMLQSASEAEALLFAATTLKGKVAYDLAAQVQPAQMVELRDQVLVLLRKFAGGPRPVRVQLCVCLAVLAIQMTAWKDVLPVVLGSLGSDAAGLACVLDFLRVLPEEVTEGRKVTLSEDALATRTSELLGDNAEQVLALLTQYAQSSSAAKADPLLLECITSWLREVPVASVVGSPLLDVVLEAMGDDATVQAASDCLGTICRETRDVDDNVDVVETLLPRILALRPLIRRYVDADDADSFRAITLLFADAGDAWVVAIARAPTVFRPLVDALLECAALDRACDVVRYTFSFWYELKQYLVLERYMESRLALVDVYARLVDILLQRLEYPRPDPDDADAVAAANSTASTGTGLDLFDGDREQEERFREFRHHMGDTLKDACEVLGVTECLAKVLDAVQAWQARSGPGVTADTVPDWQALEAPLFAMRAMGRMVGRDEAQLVPQLMPLLVQVPPHEKLRFAAIMVFGRYTDWTAAHPAFLEAQFNYIITAFASPSLEIVRAAAQAIKFFCTDCKSLLGDQVVQLQQFYDGVLDKLPDLSQEEMTEGVANVVAAQPQGDTYRLLKLYVDPLVERLKKKAVAAADAAESESETAKLRVADHLQLITMFVQTVVPAVPAGDENPAVRYWQDVFPVLATVLDTFYTFTPICERVCRCWRVMVVAHRTAMTPLLPLMADKLAQGFAASRQGCFLWVTGAILREFGEDREHVDAQITDSIYRFFEQQATAVLRAMAALPPAELPDVIEDFFRLLVDALLYHAHRLIASDLFTPIFDAAVAALALEQREPLSATLHYLRDLLTHATANPAVSRPANSTLAPGIDADQAQRQQQATVTALLVARGDGLVKQVLAGMMITFPRDCFADGSGVLLSMFELLPGPTTSWVERTLAMLPAGTVSAAEAHALTEKIAARLQNPLGGGLRQVRALLQDFTNTYRRRYVAPRDGLGALEAARFRFSG